MVPVKVGIIPETTPQTNAELSRVNISDILSEVKSLPWKVFNLGSITTASSHDSVYDFISNPIN